MPNNYGLPLGCFKGLSVPELTDALVYVFPVDCRTLLLCCLAFVKSQSWGHWSFIFLLLIYMMKSITHLIFADDHEVYQGFKWPRDCLLLLSGIDYIRDWFSTNSMMLNFSRIIYFFFTRKGNILNYQSFYIAKLLY
jgi:hypothetical protein